jgi:hypothetical protein
MRIMKILEEDSVDIIECKNTTKKLQAVSDPKVGTEVKINRGGYTFTLIAVKVTKSSIVWKQIGQVDGLKPMNSFS